MKRILLPLAALLLSMSVNAQTVVVKSFDGDKAALKNEAASLKSLPGETVKVKKAPAKVLADNQRYVGNDIDETVPASGSGLGLGYYTTGNVKMGSLISSDVLSSYAGMRVVGMRFALVTGVGSSTVEVSELLSTGTFSDALLSATVESTTAGWNEVMFATSYTLKGTEDLFVDYSYNQISGSSDQAYPVGVSGTGVSYGLMAYGNLNSQYGEGWYNMGTSYGNLMVQLIVEQDEAFLSYDLAIDGISTAKYVKANGSSEASLNFTVHNNGNKTVNAATFTLSVDGTSLGDLALTADDNITIGGSKTQLSTSISLPALEMGSHSLTLSLKDVMGEAPAGNLDDDAASATFNAYKEAKWHQKQLVEQFTSTYCTYCPYGYTMLNQLAADRGDLAWVGIHDGYKDDAYSIDGTEYITSFEGVNSLGNPAGAFNRYYIEDTSINNKNTLAVGLGYNPSYAAQVSAMFSGILDESNENSPAFADVNIDTKYDAATNALDIKVYGEGVEGVAQYMGDAALTIYLTEDSLKANQYSPTGWQKNYAHNGVLRKIVTANLGDALVWNGTNYEMSYSTTLTSSWKAENMNVIAVLAPQITYANSKFTPDVRNAAVYNCEMVKVGESVTAIENTVVDNDDANAAVVARYTANGQQVSAPVKGLNILKLANGKTVKVMVK